MHSELGEESRAAFNSETLRHRLLRELSRTLGVMCVEGYFFVATSGARRTSRSGVSAEALYPVQSCTLRDFELWSYKYTRGHRETTRNALCRSFFLRSDTDSRCTIGLNVPAHEAAEDGSQTRARRRFHLTS